MEPPEPTQPTAPGGQSGPFPVGDGIAGYTIVSELGRGGMGIVCMARQHKLNRMVAMKMLSGRYTSEELQRFQAEAETAATLHHSHIVQIYEVGDHAGRPYFSMEYVEGGCLSDRLRSGPMPPREAAELLLPVVRAVHFAHSQGVVHRDLKPANILLDPDGAPKIADFGIAKRLDSDSSLTVSGAVVGTPTYMAPEQAGGASRTAGPPADIYSLGAILYEMLTGRPPFLPDESPKPLLLRVLTEEPVSPAYHRSSIPRDLESICLKCLQKDPKHRYASAAALAEDLRRYLADEPILAKPPTRITRSLKWARRHPAKLLLLAILAAAAAFGFLRWRHWERFEKTVVEFAFNLDFVHGAPEPLAPLSADQAKKCGVCLKFTRRGSAGPVVRVELINSRGNPARVREVFGFDWLPNWLETPSGALAPQLQNPETTTLEFRYEEGKVAQVTSLDRNGNVSTRAQFRINPDGSDPSKVLVKFSNRRGFDFSVASGASHLQLTRDAAGHDIRASFYDGAGNPRRNGEGVYQIQFLRDASGRTVRLTHLDSQGRPMANHAGIFETLLEWDSQGRVAKATWGDGNGHPIGWRGFVSVISESDAYHNIVRLRRVDAQGHPADATHDRWATADYLRNERGEVTEIRYASASGVPLLVPRVSISYDENGHPAEMATFDSADVVDSRTHYQSDAAGNVLEQKSVEDSGVLWQRHHYDSAHRLARTEDMDEEGKLEFAYHRSYENDRLSAERWEDADGQPCTPWEGQDYSRIDYHYHANGYVSERLFSGYDAEAGGASSLRQTYDETGRTVEEMWRDQKGNPAKGPGGWAIHRIERSGDSVIETFLDANGQEPARTKEGYSSVRYRQDPAGDVPEKLQEGFDPSGGFVARLLRLDDRGLVEEQSFLGPDGRAVNGKDGWATVHYAYTELGLTESENYFDANGNPAFGSNGSHSLRWEFNAQGHPVLAISTGFDPAKCAWQRMETRNTLTPRGHLKETTRTYFDAQGANVRGPYRCLKEITEYNEDGLTQCVWWADCDPSAMPAPVIKTEHFYDEDGNRIRTLRQHCDAMRQPLASGKSGTAATVESIFSPESEILVSMNETGFDTAYTGFSRREVAFNADGATKAVKHFGADGIQLASVRVVVSFVAPDAQEAARQLQPGDQLISNNGTPVTSAYGFAQGPQFAGGFIEVLRNGKRLKIEPLAAGKIGIILEDKGG